MVTKTSNNSSVLVAIAKLETKMDSLTIDVRDLKDGMKSDIEFLKVDKMSRGDAVRIQTEDMVRHDKTDEEVEKQGERITNLEDSRIVYRAQLKVWVLLGGGIWTIITLILGTLIALKLHYNA